ncbi:hypothetical protein [Tardiphaga sp. 285_C5_N1_2]|uniref:hypothetical protein n=1 Tax=Tardiphaga sp. 285_C5_N1_2 TaxID=3240775 RepID=UPI003F89779E
MDTQTEEKHSSPVSMPCFFVVAGAKACPSLGIDAVVDDDLRSIWYRSAVPSQFSRGPVLGRPAGAHPVECFHAGSDGIGRRALDEPSADTYKAETKPYQLLIAYRCGFLVPETFLATTSPP